MYCGDETGAFVGEVASHSCRFGYGGDDCPKSVFPSYMFHDGTVPTTTHRVPPQTIDKSRKATMTKTTECDDADTCMDDGASDGILHDDLIPIYEQCCHDDGNGDEDGRCDPNRFLVNDGIVQNWDAWENAWCKSFDDLAVRRYGKHTRGTAQVKTRRRTTAAGRMTHTGKRDRARFDNNDDGHDDNAAGSSTIRTSADHAESLTLMHPLLAIDPGYTHYHLHTPQSNSNPKSTSNACTTGALYQNALRRKQKTTATEILFEALAAPATFFAPSPMLASFASGRQNSLVVDIGARGTRVTPVVDGLLLENAQRRSGRGGEWLGRVQKRALEDIVLGKGNGATIVHPRYAVSRNNGQINVKYPPYSNIQQTIFHRLAIRDVMYEMKTSPHIAGIAIYREQDWTIPFVDSNNTTTEDDNNKNNNNDNTTKNNADISSSSDEDDATDAKKYYVLPDGTRIDLRKNKPGHDLCRLPELFFSDEIPFLTPSSRTQPHPSTTKNTTTNAEHGTKPEPTAPTFSTLPVHELVKASLTAVADADVRKELCGNIVLSGGSSLFPNLEQRLSLEISHLIPSAYRCKVIASRSTMERRYAAWIGGSILTSLGSFQQLWLSKAEYEEYGSVLAMQRFP